MATNASAARGAKWHISFPATTVPSSIVLRRTDSDILPGPLPYLVAGSKSEADGL